MSDFALSPELPAPFDGQGVVEVANHGKAWHEISLVRTPAGETAQDVLDIVHSQQPPPSGFEIHELVWVLDPHQTAYVRFDLPPGHYVALCLIDDRAERGMTSELDVS